MRVTTAILATTLLAAAAPAAASAATLEPLNACYRSLGEKTRETVHVKAGGFQPGSKVDVSIDGTVVSSGVTALPDGTIDGTVTAPYQRRGQRPFSLTVTEQQRRANTITAQSRIAALDMRLKPSEATPSSRVRFLGVGFIDGDGIYGHYVRRGKLRKTVLLGRPQGPCGRIDERHRQIPIRRPKTGRWTLQVDNEPVYTPHPATVFVRLDITVKRVIGTP
jgi:hypothetical protein